VGSKGIPWVFNLPASVQWWGAYLSDRAGAKLDPIQERAQKDRADRELKELELEVRRGNLVSVEETISARTAIANAVRTNILSVPSKTAQELAASNDTAECQQITETALAAALQQIAEAKVVDPGSGKRDGEGAGKR